MEKSKAENFVRVSCEIVALKIIHAFFLIGTFSHLAMANELGSASSSALIKKSQLNSSNSVQQMPVITNEAEYAAWVRKREGSGQSSSVKKSESSSSQSNSSRSGKVKRV